MASRTPGQGAPFRTATVVSHGFYRRRVLLYHTNVSRPASFQPPFCSYLIILTRPVYVLYVSSSEIRKLKGSLTSRSMFRHPNLKRPRTIQVSPPDPFEDNKFSINARPTAPSRDVSCRLLVLCLCHGTKYHSGPRVNRTFLPCHSEYSKSNAIVRHTRRVGEDPRMSR